MSGMVFRWDDAPIIAEAERAATVALARVGMDAVAEAKPNAPVGVDRPSTGHRGGTYQRSLRTAEPGHLGEFGGDYEEAADSDLAATSLAAVIAQVARTGNGDLLLLFGSWVWYAWFIEHGVLSVPNYPAQPTIGPAADVVATQERFGRYVAEAFGARAPAQVAD